MNEQFIDKKTVAFLDVLGFHELLITTPLYKLAKAYDYSVSITNIMNRQFQLSEQTPTLFPYHKQGDPWCNRYIFSDSIILISNGDDLISCLKLLVYARRLIQTFLAMKFSVRGGIAHGELYENKITNVVMGQALTNAFELEKKQQWIGAAIDETVEHAYPELTAHMKDNNNLLSTIFLRYPVPFKNGITKDLHTLNWRFNLIVQKGTRSLFNENDDADVVEKINNTLAYARTVVNSGNIYSKNEETLPVELRAMWVGDAEPPFKHGDDL